jgi:hypothetical protein
VKLVCLPSEAELINKDGTRVRLPLKGKTELVEIDSRELPATLSADAPEAVEPADFDLVALAMQEPQYRAPSVRALLDAVAETKVPCMSIMNMPPLSYLARIPGLDVDSCRDCYTDPTVWDAFDPVLMTLCSPDPQAFRPADEKTNVLQVSLPTNFRVARFDSEDSTAMLRRMQADIESVRFDTGNGPTELPVKLKVYDSVFVPLAKWSMLLTGNYRCIQKDATRSIKDAVLSDVDASRSVYNWVGEVCKALGASDADQVPFEKYANVARSLVRPSSAAWALQGGATDIERVDRLVQSIAAQRDMHSNVVDELVAIVEARLDANRRAAA